MKDESELTEEEKRLRREELAVRRIQLWYARKKGKFAARIKELAATQVTKENKSEDALRMKAKLQTAALLGETEKSAEAAPSSYHGKHSVAHAVDHAALLDAQFFDVGDELVDAAMWPTLLEPATFMDTHVTKEVVERALRLSTEAEIIGSEAQSLVYFDKKGVHQKIMHSITGRSKVVSEKWLGGGRLERWVPREQVENLPTGHQGAWRVRFKPQFSFDRDVIVYMSNNEAGSRLERERCPTKRHGASGF